MVRTQIQLTEEQSVLLRGIARRRQASMAELVREGVDMVIQRETQPDREQRLAALRAIAGKYHSGLTDVGRNHDKYLEEVYLG
jgi:Arc/MetJ-type ribon-helix-helix transcriptional regulator